MDDYDVPRPSKGPLKNSFNKETNIRNSNERTHFSYSVTPQVDSEVEDYQIPSPFKVSAEQSKVESNELVHPPLYSQPKKKDKKNSPSTDSYGSSGIGTLNREMYDVPRELSDDMFREIKVNVDADSDYDEIPTQTDEICQKADEPDYDHVAMVSSSDEMESSSEEDDASSEEGVYNVPPSSLGEGVYDVPPSSEDVVIYNIPTSSNHHQFGINTAKVEVILCAKSVIEIDEFQPDQSQHLQISSLTDANHTPIVLTPSHNTQQERFNSSAPPEDGDDMVSVDFHSPEEPVVHWDEHEENLKNKLKKYLTINTISRNAEKLTKPRKPSVAERKIVPFCVPLMTLGVLLASVLIMACVVSYLYVGYQFGYIEL